jgi:hypothetical protein
LIKRIVLSLLTMAVAGLPTVAVLKPALSYGSQAHAATISQMPATAVGASSTSLPVTLSGQLNDVGVTSDTSTASGNFDGYGGSYSAQALQAAGIAQGGTVLAGGVTFQWPGNAPGQATDVLAHGQTVTLATPVAGTALAFLGAAAHHEVLSSLTITFADGSTQTASLGFSDWTLNNGASRIDYGNQIVASLPYRNQSNGQRASGATYVYLQQIPLQSSKQIVNVTLPSPSSGLLHISAMSIVGAQLAGPAPVLPTSTSVPPTSTMVPPTSTMVPPTSTSVPPTSTMVPPTSTSVPSTSTSVPPTAAKTPVPPTSTSSATPVPPTATFFAQKSCAAGWSCADIGGPAAAGSATLSNGTWTVQASGGDIWNTADQFYFAWQTLAANGSVSARVVSQTNTSTWAKAGVMLRASTDPGAAFYDVLVTRANGIVVQYRQLQGGTAAMTPQLSGTAPAYVRIVRSGTSCSAYTSSDGVTWTLAPGSTLTVSGLSGALLAGMATTSHANGTLSTVTYTAVNNAGLTDTTTLFTATSTSVPSTATSTQAPPSNTATKAPTLTATTIPTPKPTAAAIPTATPSSPSGAATLWPLFYHTFGAAFIGETVPSNPANVSELQVASSIGLSFTYVDYTTNSTFVNALHQYHMTYVDYTPWRYIYDAMRNSCPNISTSTFSVPDTAVSGNNACTMSASAQNTLYSEMQSHLDTVGSNPDISGMWLLDDWYGNMLPQLEHIHSMVQASNLKYHVNRPTMCGFSGTLDYKNPNTGTTFPQTAHQYFDRALNNYSPQSCDIVSPYVYGVLPYQDTTGSDWAMTNLMPYVISSFEAKGWNPNKAYMVFMAHTYSDSANATGWHIALPTASEVETQVSGACRGGAVGIMPFDWDYKQDGTQRLYNTAQLRQGYAAGIQDCRAYFSSHP